MSSTETERDRRLLAYVGHELRNPLAGAMINVSVVGEMLDEGDPRRPRIDQAMRELDRVSELLTSLLTFGRTGSPALCPLDLAQVVRRVAGRFAEGSVTVTAPEGAVGMQADPRLIEQAIENLVQNSVNAGASLVEIMLDREPGEVILHIEDDGRGVPGDLNELIFNPLVSGRGSTGLGLAMAREVVEGHGGSLTLLPAKSGALFRISFPVSA